MLKISEDVHAYAMPSEDRKHHPDMRSCGQLQHGCVGGGKGDSAYRDSVQLPLQRSAAA